MGPKVEAALDFIAGGGEKVVITDLDDLEPALAGDKGTHIVP
jgi:carbamate kinase